ncbi:amidohydrolase [Salsipaludibacter albus]|uniref:amidohydrolase n=1 Tax=Salsipaludibacter albus TaxID=2849650 RepID=UPI001EE4E3A8|nr:amidohydrolase family protein [Salsipaludibacter albus]MBY5161143.1 amidohydrolase family protein [Salsipaludibacter albus]
MTEDLLVVHDVRRPGEDQPLDLVVGGGRIRALGPAGSAPTTADVDRIDAGGRIVAPGLWDMHVHVGQWALARRRLDLFAADSADDVATRISAKLADGTHVGEFLVGRRMRSALWTSPPHRDLLDRVAPDVPVVVTNIDLHTAWLNGAALARFGLADHPTGVLREAACYRVVEALADTSLGERDEAVAAALQDAADLGVVGVKDFEFSDAVADWLRRVDRGLPPVRVDTSVYAARLDDAIDRGWPTGTVVPGTGERVRAGHLKLFVDGALNSGTALCHEPTPGMGSGSDDDHAARGAGSPDDDPRGHLATPPDELRALMARAWQHGIAPAVHAIGDLAVTMALDAFDHVGCPGRIEHVQLVADDDLGRFDRPGLVASVQPTHATDDRDVTDLRWADRAGRAYRFADLVAAGARLEFGSDAPVSPLDPWAAIAVAVERTDDDRPAWHPEQALDRATALAAATRGRTRVTVGDPADLVLLDDDPLACEVSTLRAGPVWATMVAGTWSRAPD